MKKTLTQQGLEPQKEHKNEICAAGEGRMTCKHCGKSILDLGPHAGALRYRHEDGYYGCEGRRGNANAEPENDPKLSALPERKK